jgi:hypothetical protein
MNRLAPLLLALIALLVPGAQAAHGQVVQGGYDEATDQLEQGFKIVATQRIGSDTECYPAPDEVATVLQREMDIDVVVAPTIDSVEGFELVNVISDQTECNRLVLAIRAGAKGRIFVLDSDYGPVYVQGDRGLSDTALAAGAGPLRDLTAATADFRMSKLDELARYEVFCPEGTYPLGGGMFNATPLAEDGEGIYPHSYERLGVQNGFHVTPVLVDPSTERTRPRRGVLQVICGQGLVPTISPHETVFVQRRGTGTVTARCPEGTQLFSGGFQRTNFTTPGVVGYGGIKYGGNYITESRAVGRNAWRVSAGAVDQDGGELTAIAHCADDPSLPLSVVEASTEVGDGELGAATTPRCPRGRELTAGGFSFNGSHDALFAEGYFTRKGTYAATAFGWFGPVEMTVYGYCLKTNAAVDRSEFPPARAYGGGEGEDEDDDRLVDGPVLVAGLAAAGLALILVLLRLRARRRYRAP